MKHIKLLNKSNNKNINQWNKIESSKTSPHVYGKLIL